MMFTDGRGFDTNIFFSGGAGMFIQYHDVVKPVYLYAIFKMLMTKTSFGLPLDIIQNFSVLSLIEWYIKRRYINPLRSLDFLKKIDPNELDSLLYKIIDTDPSIYHLSPSLNIRIMLRHYRKQQMSFPVYIYSEREEPNIQKDCKEIFSGIKTTYLHGDLKEAVAKCDQNFTYIFSDIELVKNISEILIGTCSHILLAREYRYNYIDNCHTLKYDLNALMRDHPFIRIGTTQASDMNNLARSFNDVLSQEEDYVTTKRIKTNGES